MYRFYQFHLIKNILGKQELCIIGFTFTIAEKYDI